MSGPLSNPDPDAALPFITYALRNVRKPVGRGATGPEYGEVAAVIKQDGDESRAQVYSEYVCSRLASLVGVNAATGVVVAHSRGLRYASLLISEVGFSLTEIDDEHATEVAERYPVEAAKIAVFDMWIGNFDRSGNIRANLAESTDNLFVGIDHGCSLLSIESTVDESLLVLGNTEWPPSHIFGNLVRQYYVDSAIQRIQCLSDESIQEACLLGGTVGSIMPMDQAMLSEALVKRRELLPAIVERVLKPT